MQNCKPHLTRPDAAEFLGVSIFTLNQWASEGKGPRSIRVGRQCVYQRDELDAFKASREPAQQATHAPITTGTNYLIRLPEVMRKTGMSRSWIYAQMKAGLFPMAISLGARAVAWKQSSIDGWIASREAAALEVA
ncbi:AlpA family phage regulatory protein [Chromobacterium vaccinii]|uniref:helix-turn-helix transcriptional regulator n=1 Tax=Chromobacterium vaccinii TaxID=1108595 RepID=UPI001E3C1C61|nr:AlpA family phage regulatory protein [Chromobacterium vaccinii]MCD4487005.1 AlpA family phage regulatory protein [Chromobacterium vaccinii]